MRLTQFLSKDPKFIMKVKQWKGKRTRVVLNTGADKSLIERGIVVEDALKFACATISKKQIDFVPTFEHGLLPPIKKSEMDHPHYHDRMCHIYQYDNVLVKGLKQAKVITKSVELQPGLPENVSTPPDVLLPEYHHLVERILMSSNVFDATQEKLPKYVDPKRPAHVHRRLYGIPDYRRIFLQTMRLVTLCSTLCGIARPQVKDAPVRLTFTKDKDLIQLDLRADLLITTDRPLAPPSDTLPGDDVLLPDLWPARHCVSLATGNIYVMEDVYPLKTLNQCPHTVVFHCDLLEVKNLFETPVTEEQIMGRSLLNSFAFAAAYARKRYGDDVKDLPEPFTLQVVQTTGKLFHFGVFQLNTLNLESSHHVKNIFWSEDILPLYEKCEYISAIPTLEGYNPAVFDTLLSFYMNGRHSRMKI